ncbi:hypothetical protein I601_1937 [Nocardioides dokdonensis FR1436]|uniref:DoxX n=1 Tax=Nocardioides dokdonensis FR1436 TaxID=1300347 RepID=A0A1A9GJ64_9ACTN|nr:DoxX family membrane protein [Nocardioides dokdonensis]ANH38367.1 hypothetical protein I601_1937 [Nocardioides dokdonensis FR1436]
MLDQHPVSASPSSRPAGNASPLLSDDRGAHQAYLLLRTVLTIAPIAFGLDKFFGVLVDWDVYLAGWIDDLAPGTAHQAMLAVGVVEIAAGVLVALAPRLGAPVVALWLAGIIVNLVSMGQYYDIALRDAGLFVAALALYRLAVSPAAHAARAEAVDNAARR